MATAPIHTPENDHAHLQLVTAGGTTPPRLPPEIRAALCVAENLSIGTSDALRYTNEGPLSDRAAFADDAISSAAQGLHDMMRIERPHLVHAGDKDGLDALDHLCHEISRFMVDWIGERQ